MRHLPSRDRPERSSTLNTEHTPPIPTWIDLARRVDLEGGSFVTSMGMLKAIATGTRTGKRTSDNLIALVSEQLATRHLGYWPAQLPHRQEAQVWIYRADSPGGEIFETLRRAAGTPDRGDLNVLAEAVKALNRAHASSESERMAALDAPAPNRARKRSP